MAVAKLVKPKIVPLIARAERYAAGKALRGKTPRDTHAAYEEKDKRDPVGILVETGRARIQNLLPIRYERMAVSPFTFLRGAAAVMVADLAKAPRAGIAVQSCGDCHLMNFGAFETPEGKVLFDVNDFDETLPDVDFTFDVKRLAASVAVAALDAGLSEKKSRATAKAAITAYREFMLELATRSPLDVWHTRMEVEREAALIGDDDLHEIILSTLNRALRQSATTNDFPNLVHVKGGGLKIVDRPPLIYHVDDGKHSGQEIDVAAVFGAYRETLAPERRLLVERYSLQDVAFKVVGVGSVGTWCAIGLFATADSEPLFLQIKEAQVSVLDGVATKPQPQDHQGRRVVEGQRIMQAASDVFLGWTECPVTKRQFYIRHLKNRRLGSIGEVIRGNALEAYVTLCGRTLARGHARSGDPAMLAGYMGKSDAFDIALAEFAMRYAKQSVDDHGRLVAWMAANAIAATESGSATKPGRIAKSQRN